MQFQRVGARRPKQRPSCEHSWRKLSTTCDGVLRSPPGCHVDDLSHTSGDSRLKNLPCGQSWKSNQVTLSKKQTCRPSCVFNIGRVDGTGTRLAHTNSCPSSHVLERSTDGRASTKKSKLRVLYASMVRVVVCRVCRVVVVWSLGGCCVGTVLFLLLVFRSAAANHVTHAVGPQHSSKTRASSWVVPRVRLHNHTPASIQSVPRLTSSSHTLVWMWVLWGELDLLAWFVAVSPPETCFTLSGATSMSKHHGNHTPAWKRQSSSRRHAHENHPKRRLPNLNTTPSHAIQTKDRPRGLEEHSQRQCLGSRGHLQLSDAQMRQRLEHHISYDACCGKAIHTRTHTHNGTETGNGRHKKFHTHNILRSSAVS